MHCTSTSINVLWKNKRDWNNTKCLRTEREDSSLYLYACSNYLPLLFVVLMHSITWSIRFLNQIHIQHDIIHLVTLELYDLYHYDYYIYVNDLSLPCFRYQIVHCSNGSRMAFKLTICTLILYSYWVWFKTFPGVYIILYYICWVEYPRRLI